MTLISPQVVGAPRVTLMQGSVKLWDTDEDVEAYRRDPASYLFARSAPIRKSVTMDTNNILVATYIFPDRMPMKGPDGKPVPFFFTDKTIDESGWQGRCGLLIAKGPMAWVDDEKVRFHGCTHQLGEWLTYDRQDGRQIIMHGVHCRRLYDVNVWGKTDAPMEVY